MTLESVKPTAIAAPPKLIPVFLINFKISPDPEPVYSDKLTGKGLNLATVVDGQITTVENELGLEFDVDQIKGFDDLTNDLQTGTTFLDCKVYGKIGNQGVYITYPGVLNLNQPTVDVLTKKSTTTTFEDSYITNTPKFVFDTTTVDKKYHWVLKENFHGKGRFVRDDEGVLYVQYYVYVYR